MRVLVTGGAGFIGSAVVDQLVDAGHDVVVLDALVPAAHRGCPDYLNPAARYLWGDVRDRQIVRRAVDGIDAVSHQAAMVGLGVDFGDVASFVDNNDGGTASLLLGLHERGFTGRLVLAGSMVVYGDGRYRCAEHGLVRAAPRAEARLEAGDYDPRCPDCGGAIEPEPVPEDAPLDPRNVYAATKLHQEHLCGSYAREHGSVAIALRYHNVYGPRMPRDTPYAGVASIFRSAAARGERPRVFEDGRQLRDFVHVDDVARANVLAIERPDGDAPSCAFNVASGAPHSVYELAAAIASARDSAASTPEVVGGHRLGDVRHVFASTERARTGLAFEARVGFAEGVGRFANEALRR